MAETIGRRAANKRATRSAIDQAAKRLFRAQGYEATTVRQIADAAGVTERTFYRYFDGKQGLVAEDVDRWIETLHDAIRDRPAHEPPAVAVRRALVALRQEIAKSTRAKPIWLFTNQPRPYELLQKSAPRPLLRFEQAITDAILARTESEPDAETRFNAELVARVAVAMIRSAAIYQRELELADSPERPNIDQILRHVDTALAGLTHD
jgi:AcrR family transcriptional regulator